jgi:hypothetical protein
VKIRCFRLECEVCKVLGSCQVFFNNQGIAKYSRVRHYDKRVNGKPLFVYHAQSLPYVTEKLGDLRNSGQQIGQITKDNVGQQNFELSSELLMARDVGLEPTRPFDHRLSRPAPYQAWGIPHALVFHIMLSSALFRCSMLT